MSRCVEHRNYAKPPGCPSASQLQHTVCLRDKQSNSRLGAQYIVIMYVHGESHARFYVPALIISCITSYIPCPSDQAESYAVLSSRYCRPSRAAWLKCGSSSHAIPLLDTSSSGKREWS